MTRVVSGAGCSRVARVNTRHPGDYRILLRQIVGCRVIVENRSEVSSYAAGCRVLPSLPIGRGPEGHPTRRWRGARPPHPTSPRGTP